MRIFLRTLLWNISDDQKPRALALNGSPSWSWSSIQAKINYPDDWIYLLPHPNADPRFFLKESIPATSNPFGQVSGGRIGVLGYHHPYTGGSTFAAYHAQKRLARLVVGDKEVEERRREDTHNPIIFEGFSDTHFTPKESVEAQLEPDWADHYLTLDVLNPDYEWNAIQHIMLFIGRWGPTADPNDDLSTEQAFLILRPAQSKPKAYYERVGIANARSPYCLDICRAEGWVKSAIYLV